MSRNALSQEEVIRYIEQNSTAKLLPPFYKNNRSKLKLECECGNIFYTTFSSFKKQGKTRCDECVKNSAGKKSKEINSVQKELIAKGFQIVDGIYKNNKSKLLLKDIEGYFYLSSLVTIRANGSKKFHSSNPYTLQNVNIFLEKSSKKYRCTSTQYKGHKQNLDFICESGHIFSSTLNSLHKRKHCPECYETIKLDRTALSHDEFVQKVNTISNNIEILGEYKGTDEKILCKCKNDGHTWMGNGGHLLRGTGCPKCKGLNKKTEQDFLEKVDPKNNGFKILTNFTGAKDLITCECTSGHIWTTSAKMLLRGCGCPKCRSSKGEKELRNIFTSLNINFIEQYSDAKCKNKNILYFDFFLPEYNTCVEYDGEGHYFPVKFGGMSESDSIKQFGIQKKRDEIKNSFCQVNNINILRIPYTEKDVKLLILDYINSRKLVIE